MAVKADTALYIESHRKWYVVSFGLSALVFSWAALVAHRHALTGWEQHWLLAINHWPNRWVRYFEAITAVGGSPWTAVVAVVLTFLLQFYRLSWRLSATFLLATTLTYGAKHIVDRAQPAIYVAGLHVRAMALGTAFPSGATVIATVIALSLLPYLPLKWRVLLPIWVGAVGLSRLYLGLYAPLDVIGGLALGVFLVSLIRIMPQALRVVLRLD
ncbi:MAG TPA: phosphatase PAP2 family protein [Candidatus Saccharimonadales bacterium]|nr:phosphatase PAP2 family protein [Candidatus Saccharimonadales bacterium]